MQTALQPLFQQPNREFPIGNGFHFWLTIVHFLNTNLTWGRLARQISCLLLAQAFAQSAFAFTKSGTIYTTDGSQSDVNAAIAKASAGDTITIPAGIFTWGDSGSSISLNKAVTLLGQGTNTIIQISSGAGTYGNGTIRLSASGAVAQNFKVVQPGTGKTTAFSTGTANGWRISQITYISSTNVGYFVYAGTYGLIDNCDVTGGIGNDELIFGRGPTDSWQTASSMGTANAVYIEDCVFRGSGYVCDANSNARFVVRFCTIIGPMKVDGHGKASNTPARGVRHMEVYGNNWMGGSYIIELRGGTGIVFGNNASSGWWVLHEYGSTATWPNFGKLYQTPSYYPVDDQIGVGIDPKASGSEPYYLWSNTNGASLMSGPNSLAWKTVPAGAIQQYTNETGNASATFTMQDIIKADRDYFIQTNNFTGTSGVGTGTKSQMFAITPTKTGVGFWVTDEGSWNTTLPANTSGQLYTWNGSAWVLKYTPFTYPYPFPTSGQTGKPIGPTAVQVSIHTNSPAGKAP